MTAPRIVRGTKARIFLYICGCIVIIGLLACYNNTLSQLESARKSSEICHQQEENLSTQLQVITEYKQRLERSLKTEKAVHQQTKNELENKLHELKNKNENSEREINIRFSALQQHYKLLETQHNDFKEECSKKQNQQLNEINDLQAKLKEVQEELRKVESAKETLKAENQQLQIDKENLYKQTKNLLSTPNDDTKIEDLTKQNQDLQKQLDNIRLKYGIPLQSTVSELSSKTPQVLNKPMNNYENQVIAIPKDQSSSTTKSTTNAKVSQGALNNARPIMIPTVTPKSANKNNNNNNNIDNNFNDFNINDNNNKQDVPYPYKSLPHGVVAPPENQREKTDDKKNELLNNDVINSRYRNKIDNPIVRNNNNNDDDENRAHEVIDGQQGHPYDAIGFDDPVKQGDKLSGDKQHINNLVVGNGGDNKLYDYKDNHNDIQMEDEDDVDEYEDQDGRQKDPAVRN